MKDFKGLKVWESAHAMTLQIYEATRKFPAEELYGLTAQLRRSAASIGANIAEGCGRDGDAELNRYLSVAKGSASETEYHLLLARDLKLLDEATHSELNRKTAEIQMMLTAFMQKLQGLR